MDQRPDYYQPAHQQQFEMPSQTVSKNRVNISGFLIVAWVSFIAAIMLVGSAWTSVSNLGFTDNPTMVEVVTSRAMVTAIGAVIAMAAACFFILMALYSRTRS